MSVNHAIAQIVRSVMPPRAQVRAIPGTEELNIRVSWILLDDHDRPIKPAKTIIIVVSQEAAEDFSQAANLARPLHYLSVFLRKQLSQFDPNHNTPQGEAPPVEKWVITSLVLNR